MIQPNELKKIIDSHNLTVAEVIKWMGTSNSTFWRWMKHKHTNNMNPKTRTAYELGAHALKDHIGDFKPGESLKGITHTISAARDKSLMKWAGTYKEVMNDE